MGYGTLTRNNTRQSTEFRLAYESDPFGRGNFSVVYRGTFNRGQVAVKRVPKANLRNEKNVTMAALDHRNVVKLFYVEDEKYFRCFALELCAATLEDYCTGKFDELAPNELEWLLDMAEGLEYIHSKNLVHCDIKPRNVLISFPDDRKCVRLKISDFGLCRLLTERRRFSLDPVKGTPVYLAPELVQSLEKKELHFTSSGDVFSLGCTFYFYLTRGAHPFGSTLFISATIPKAVRNTSSLNGHPVQALIRSMITLHPGYRPRMADVIDRLMELRPSLAASF